MRPSAVLAPPGMNEPRPPLTDPLPLKPKPPHDSELEHRVSNPRNWQRTMSVTSAPTSQDSRKQTLNLATGCVCAELTDTKPLAAGKMTPAGLEPAIPGSVGRCLIHWATGPDVRARSEAVAMVDVHRKTASHIIYLPCFEAQPRHEANAPLGIQNMTPCKRIEHLNATRRRARQI